MKKVNMKRPENLIWKFAFFFYFWTLYELPHEKQWVLPSVDLNVRLSFASGNAEGLEETKFAVFTYNQSLSAYCLRYIIYNPIWLWFQIAVKKRWRVVWTERLVQNHDWTTWEKRLVEVNAGYSNENTRSSPWQVLLKLYLGRHPLKVGSNNSKFHWFMNKLGVVVCTSQWNSAEIIKSTLAGIVLWSETFCHLSKRCLYLSRSIYLFAFLRN